MQNDIHEPLECLHHIPKSKRHAGELERTKWCSNSGLEDLMVGLREVYPGEDSGSTQVCCKMLNVQQWVVFWNSDDAECSIAATLSPVSSLFGDHG